MAHQALPLKIGQDGERRLDRTFGGSVDRAHDPQIDDLERVEAEIAQIVVDRASSSSGHMAGFHDASGPRLAPILVTITRSSG